MKARIAAPIVALITLFYVASALAQDWKPLIAPDELVALSGKVDLIDIRQVSGGAGYEPLTGLPHGRCQCALSIVAWPPRQSRPAVDGRRIVDVAARQGRD